MQNLEAEPLSGIPEHQEVGRSRDVSKVPRDEQPGQIFQNPPFRILSRPWPNRRPKIPRSASLGRTGR